MYFLQDSVSRDTDWLSREERTGQEEDDEDFSPLDSGKPNLLSHDKLISSGNQAS